MTEITNKVEQMQEDAEALFHKVLKKIESKDYVGALELAQSLVEIAPEKYMPHYYLALIYKMLRYEEAALVELLKAIDIDPEDFNSYELLLILVLRNESFDNAHLILDVLTKNDLDSFISIRWCSAWLDGQEEKIDDAKALEIYSEIAKELDESGKDYHWLPDFYFQYANLMADEQDTSTLISILDKGLQSYPDDGLCLAYKAWLLQKENRKEEARIIYERMATEKHISLDLDSLRNLASIYYSDLSKYADKALKIYQFMLQDNEMPDDHFYAGMCEFSLGNLAEAEKHFLREQEMEPDDVDGYFRLSYVYEVSGRLEEALVQINKTLEIVKSWGTDCNYSSYFEQKAYILRKMGRMAEAADTILEAKKLYGDKYEEYPVLVDIWEQAGNRANAKKALKQWKKATPNVLGNPYEGQRCTAQVKHYLLQKQFKKAQLYYADRKDAMSGMEAEDLLPVLGSISGKADKYLELCKQRYEQTDSSHVNYPGYVEDYAHALWLVSQTKEAEKIAQIALDLLNEDLKGFHRNRTVYLVQKAGALIVLGRFDEADDVLKEAENRPMCDLCAYGTCMDVDIYRVREMIHRKMRREALELTRKYQEKWPGELDFVFYENLLAN